MLFAEFKTIEEYNEANNLAHKTLSKSKGYNSPIYANEQPIISVKATYLLPLVEKFEKELNKVGLIFKEFDKSIIKQVELF